MSDKKVKPLSPELQSNGQWSLNKNSVEKADSDMALGDITELLHHIKELRSLLKPNDKLPDWVKAKLTLAADYLSTVAHYVDGKKESGSPLEKSKEKLEMLKGELVQLKDYMKHKVSDPAKAKKLISDAKKMGDKRFKDKVKSLAKEDMEKAEGWTHNPETGNFNHKLHGSIALRPKATGGSDLIHNGSVMRSFDSHDAAVSGIKDYIGGLGRTKVANQASIVANKRRDLGQE